MARTTEAVLTESASLRPDVAIPLVPLTGPARLLRCLALGRRSSFPEARNRILVWLTAAGLAVLIDRLVLANAGMTAVALALVGYTIARVVALVLVERWQHAFEWRWLDEQSSLLRRHPFEVVAMRVQVDGDSTRSAPRTVDLTNPADVGWLLDQQARRGVDVPPQARIEFGYWTADGPGRSSDSVRRNLSDLEVHPVDRLAVRPRIRFPQARYVAVGGTGPDTRWPSRVAHWSLVGPVRLTTVRAG